LARSETVGNILIGIPCRLACDSRFCMEVPAAGFRNRAVYFRSNPVVLRGMESSHFRIAFLA